MSQRTGVLSGRVTEMADGVDPENRRREFSSGGSNPPPSAYRQFVFTINVFVDATEEISHADAMEYTTIVFERFIPRMEGMSWQYANAEPKG